MSTSNDDNLAGSPGRVGAGGDLDDWREATLGRRGQVIADGLDTTLRGVRHFAEYS